MQTRRVSSQVLLGAIVVLVGVVLLSETTGYPDTVAFWTYLPSLLVLVGVFALVTSGFRNPVGPVAIVAVAGAWQLVTLESVTADQVLQLWPLLIVLFGASIIL